MATFRFQALNREQQVVTGDIDAATVLEAIKELEARGLTVQSIGQPLVDEAANASLLKPHANPGAHHTASAEATAAASAEIAIRDHIGQVLDHSQRILPVLRSYAKELPSRERHRIESLVHAIEGSDLDRAIGSFPDLADDWINLFRATAASTDQSSFVQEFVGRARFADTKPRGLGATLAYPMVVGCIALVVIALFFIVVLPIFDEILTSFDSELPFATELLLSLPSLFTSSEAVVTALIIAAAGILLPRLRRLIPNIFTRTLDALFPFSAARSMALGRMLQNTATLLDAGFSRADALQVAKTVTHRPSLSKSCSRIANALETKVTEQEKALSQGALASLEYAMLAEISLSSRVHLLQQLGRCYIEAALSRQNWAAGAVGPIVTCVVGIFVGWIALALLLPMVSFIAVLS